MSLPARTGRAFTLLELLLAIALITSLVAAMFAFMWDMLSTRTRIVEETTRRRAVGSRSVSPEATG